MRWCIKKYMYCRLSFALLSAATLSSSASEKNANVLNYVHNMIYMY